MCVCLSVYLRAAVAHSDPRQRPPRRVADLHYECMHALALPVTAIQLRKDNGTVRVLAKVADPPTHRHTDRHTDRHT